MDKHLRLLIASMICLASATTLVVRGGTGYCYFVLLACALGCAFSEKYRLKPRVVTQVFPWYAIAVLSFTVWLPIQQIMEGYWLPREFDGMSRLALSLPIFLVMVQMPVRTLKWLGIGCALGGIAAGTWAVDESIRSAWTVTERLGNNFTNPIPFGNTALLLAFLSAMTIRWDGPAQRWRRMTIALKLLGLLGGLYASYLSGTRGGWLAIPLLVVVCALNFRWVKRPQHWLTAVLIATLVGAGLLAMPTGRERLLATRTDFTRLSHSNASDSSIGARLELWRASVQLFERNPVLGVGKGHLERSLRSMADAGEVSPLVVNQRAHSEFFSTIAELGIAGVICLSLLYVGPLVYFVRYRHSANSDVSTAAYSGIGVSGAVIIFGLSIDVFTVVMTTSLIALIWAVLLAVITHDPGIRQRIGPSSSKF